MVTLEQMLKFAAIKKLKSGDKAIPLGMGVYAKANRDNTISYIFRSKIAKTRKNVVLKLGTKDIDSTADITNRAIEYKQLCNQGLNPKEEIAKHKAAAIKQDKKKKDNERTLGQVLEAYTVQKVGLGRNKESTVKDRYNAISSICGDWLDTPINEINLEMIADRFNNHSSQVGSPERAKTWGSYMQAIFEFAWRRSYIEKNIFKLLAEEVGGFNSNQEQWNYLMPSETSWIYDNIIHKSSIEDHPQNTERKLKHFNNFRQQRMAMLLLMLTGLRLNEVLKLTWGNVFLKEEWLPKEIKNKFKFQFTDDVPHIYYEKGSRKQRKILLAVPIVKAMKDIFYYMAKFRADYKTESKVIVSNYVFPSSKSFGKPITDIEEALKENYPAPLKKKNGVGYGKEKRVKNFTQKTLRRTFTQAGTQLGFDISQLEFATGRSDKLKTKSALGVYTSYQLEPAVEVYNKITEALLNKSDEWTDRVAIRVGKPTK